MGLIGALNVAEAAASSFRYTFNRCDVRPGLTTSDELKSFEEKIEILTPTTTQDSNRDLSISSNVGC